MTPGLGAVEAERQTGTQPHSRLLRSEVQSTGSAWVWPTAALLIGLVITGLLTAIAREVYLRNQTHLLRLRVRDAEALVTALLPEIQTPLASAAELADATHGNPAKFRAFAASYTGPGREFTSMSLWSLAGPGREPLAVVGTPPKLSNSNTSLPAYFSRVARATTISVTGLLSHPDPRLGYGYSVPGPTRYAAYAETALPADHRAPLGRTSSFTGLDYALYLGRGRPSNLLLTNVSRLPLSGDTASVRVPFGDSALVLSMSALNSLSGSLPRDLPWIILGGGVLLSLAAAGAAWRLSEGRRYAERMAGELEQIARENRQLYAEQRTIAQTLQHALLPAELPQVPGLEASARYESGERSVDIGGDWYDLIELPDGRLLFVVGDVSGRGLAAGTTMAALRYAIHAYAAQNDAPEVILSKLSALVSLARDGQMATILCARIDVEDREVTVASAGHLPALVLHNGHARFIDAPTGIPVGIDPRVAYRSATIHVPPGATLLGYTDGLVEQRGEHLDEGLERLRHATAGAELALPQLLSKLVADLSFGPAKDDIAIVGVRWTS